jgi:mono/diheme cytochrome c family protein
MRIREVIVLLGLAVASTGLARAQAVAPEHAGGQLVYQKWCAPCHAAGITHPGTHALMTKYDGIKSGVLLEWKDLPSSVVKFWVRHGVSVMPHFRKTEISDAELEQLARYLARNTPGG